jgi:large subunit ribosomal protein L6
MSRLGKKPVTFNDKVKAEYKDKALLIKGSLGEITFTIPDDVDLNVEENSITINTDLGTQRGRVIAGTMRSIVKSAIEGVDVGFTTVLELTGVGYRAQLQGQVLTLNLGYSHPIEYELPAVVSAVVEANTKLTLKSCNKQVLGQTAAEIRKFRPPEPYKGKGILFAGEKLLRKAGKAAKGKG